MLHSLFERCFLGKHFEIRLKVLLSDVAKSSGFNGVRQSARGDQFAEEHLRHMTFHQQLTVGGDGAFQTPLLGTRPDHERTSNPISAATSKCSLPRRTASRLPLTI